MFVRKRIKELEDRVRVLELKLDGEWGTRPALLNLQRDYEKRYERVKCDYWKPREPSQEKDSHNAR